LYEKEMRRAIHENLTANYNLPAVTAERNVHSGVCDMELQTVLHQSDEGKHYDWASTLALITILYNIVEGLASVYFGVGDESMSLFGFGLDSFVEVVSGIGIWHMIRRIRRTSEVPVDRFERRALRITGTAFFVLTAGLVVISIGDMYRRHAPESTFWGIIISIVSIVSMWILINAKVKVGNQLNSPAILADAACTRACLQLSVVLLVASAGYKLTHIGGLDSAGALVIGALCYREGKEAFERAREGNFACTCGRSCKVEKKEG
jgi:divalent metal cation (Fe/Co/Zn/Cd) transporter